MSIPLKLFLVVYGNGDLFSQTSAQLQPIGFGKNARWWFIILECSIGNSEYTVYLETVGRKRLKF